MQQPFVIPDDSIRENLDPLGLKSDRQLGDAVIESSLLKVDDTLDLDSKASQLSTGQVQLLALTQSLLQLKSGKSRILLLDEPTSQIDSQSQRRIL